jgi:teichuronic acid biosynthesis glycosyltransferase TuaH
VVAALPGGIPLSRDTGAEIDHSTPRLRVVVLLLEGYRDLERHGFARPSGQLVQALLADDRVSHLTVVNASRNVSKYGIRRLQGQAGPLTSRPRDGLTVIQPLHIGWRRLPHPSRYVRRQRSIDRRLSRRLRSAKQQPCLVVSFEIYFSGYAAASWASEVVHFAQDDPSSFARFRDTGVEAAYAAFRGRRRPLMAVSPPIVARINPVGRTWVVPNGIDPGEWRQRGVVPYWFRKLPRPVGLYSGTIDDRLDLDLVVAAGRALAGGTVLLFGPADPEVRETILSRCPNAVFHEAQNRREIIGVTREVDVCLIPHIVTPQTSSMSPLKLFEYLAAGRPVASIGLPSTGGMSWVFEAQHEDEFEGVVRAALAAGEMSEADRNTFLRENSWAARFVPVIGDLMTGALRDERI